MGTMDGKICMVTGATDGIGLVTARELAAMGAAVILVGRNRAKGEAVVNAIKTATGNPAVELLVADLSAQAEVRQLAADFKAKHDRLHVLVNNAGAIFMSRQETGDGIEFTFGLNHLNYFLLTHLLLDVIKASAPARIVNVSSDAHVRGHINFADLEGKRRYSGFRAYSQSKLANVLFTYELARRLEGTHVTANVLHPGFVRTKFGHNNNWLVRNFTRVFQRITGISVEAGAQTSIYLASSPEVEGMTGQYFVKKKAIRSNAESYNEDIAKRLWDISEEMVGIRTPAGA